MDSSKHVVSIIQVPSGEAKRVITDRSDDKRYWLDDRINSLAYGHWRIAAQDFNV
jgi:hypothetical protein